MKKGYTGGVYKMGQKNLIRTSTKEEKYPKKKLSFQMKNTGDV